MDYIYSILTLTGITMIGVMGTYMVTGLTGQFSFGQAAFMAVGGYVSAMLTLRFGLPFPVVALLGAAAATLAGWLVGLPTVRLRRDYISLVTFGFGEAIISVLNNSAQLTGGAEGLVGIPKRVDLPLVLVSVICCLFLVACYKNSRYGRQSLALRTDELAARSMGIDVNRMKLVTFLFASAITGYAGVLYAFYSQYLEPGYYNWTVSAEWLIIVFVGGINSLTGAMLSALVLTTLPELLRFASSWRILIYCVIVLLIINYRPNGIFGDWEISRLWKKKTSAGASKA
ncbi:branched-chain amino acid ABC transporter permease [Propionivibrio dicarboxylicus]|uniref:Branched-chain amino acid transport system permease protein n=1 Tax=Propionivibrio dicarboxylicus TaxID=83767 RepID=A0A1G8J4M8_9RHOO|nr:branched-chain amino acid ABC transporter permease [Propionivibrio dicarboxylicus]SDI26166.1 branched-chain amino acid transport system permease protein [Propionivibrio dicarboxylicus]